MTTKPPVDSPPGEPETVWAVLRKDLVGADGYLTVLLLTVLLLVLIPIDETFRAGPLVNSLVLGLLVLVTLTRSQLSLIHI